MSKICTKRIAAHVCWSEVNDDGHPFDTLGIGKLRKRDMYEHEVLPVVIVRNYDDKFHMIGKTDISYRSFGEDYKNLKKGQWVEMEMGKKYFFRNGDMDFIEVWFHFGWHFHNIPAYSCHTNECGGIPRRDGAPPPPIDE